MECIQQFIDWTMIILTFCCCCCCCCCFKYFVVLQHGVLITDDRLDHVSVDGVVVVVVVVVGANTLFQDGVDTTVDKLFTCCG